MKILLVDDSKTMRNIQRNVLSQIGTHEVEEACDGQDALSKAKPQGVKGIYFKKVSVSSTMGAGVRVDPASLNIAQSAAH